MITNNAKGLISVIAYEVRLADERVKLGVISQSKVMGCVLEGLSAKAKRDVNMKTFLSTMAYVPEDEDIRDDVEWAEDRREARAHVVTDRDPDNIAYPVPGERIC